MWTGAHHQAHSVVEWLAQRDNGESNFTYKYE